ncbi:MAG TPA: alpha/beta hydrolase [Gemmatimonadaceae bacterium]|nr:alpha/beta hydrolase [Gemmatimonadaceae bacterium]
MRFSHDAARLVALLALASCGRADAARQYDDYMLLRGRLVAAETSAAGFRGRYAIQRVRLSSSTGLEVTGRLLRPASTTPAPAILLNDGRELNSRAIDYLPADFGDVVVLSIDYPEAIPYTVGVKDMVFNGGTIRKAARLIPASFSLAGEWLSMREDVDAERVGIVATSFAVPFATIAAAMDARFRDVGLIYGAGDFATVMAANITLRPRFLRRPAAWLATRAFREFEPERHVAQIAPRPLLMINGIDDPQMPREAVQSLYDAAREPKTVIWLRTGHLLPTDSVLIRALVDTALARLPILSRPVAAPIAP